MGKPHGKEGENDHKEEAEDVPTGGKRSKDTGPQLAGHEPFLVQCIPDTGWGWPGPFGCPLQTPLRKSLLSQPAAAEGSDAEHSGSPALHREAPHGEEG